MIIISNLPTGGTIGTAATTVDINQHFEIIQTTAGQTVTIPNITNVLDIDVRQIVNNGTVDVTIIDCIVPVGGSAVLSQVAGVYFVSRTTGFKLNKVTLGAIATIEGSVRAIRRTSIFPAVAQVNTTRVDVPGWEFPVVAGKSYKVNVLATYTSAVNTTGGSMGVILASGATGDIHGNYYSDVANTTVATALGTPLTAINTSSTLANSFMTSTGATTGQAQNFEMKAIFNCTTSGVFRVQWGSEVASSLSQIRAGSTFVIYTLN